MARDLDRRRDEHLVETDWLARHLGDPKVRVVDARGHVRVQTDPAGVQTAEYADAREEYEASHIPGSVYLGWTSDLADENDPIPAQAAPPEKLSRYFSRSGIGSDTLVIAYDSHPASQFATRLWWLLRFCGHDRVRVLNGGLPAWTAEGRPLTAERPHVAAAAFVPLARPSWRVEAEEVMGELARADACLVDARDEGQFSGAIRRGPRGGHIPGAVHLPREALIGPDGRFLGARELEEAIAVAGIPEDKRVIAYCNGGVAATVVLFALSMLGYPRLANYDGSWNEWGAREDLPVER